LKNWSLDLGNAALPTAAGFNLDEPEKQVFRKDGREETGGIRPGTDRLADLLGLADISPVQEVLHSALLDPLAELISTRGKRIRGQLVTLIYRLVSDTPLSVLAIKQCGSRADVVELIHAGSLIIDDIEDGSRVRRDRPALHIQFGIPLTLNAGNWFYFRPFEMLRETQLPNEKIFYLYEHCHRTLLRAHFGQAPGWICCPSVASLQLV
jgi:hypothetical protein